MSTPEAKAALISILNEALKENTRQVLDKQVQIVDLNKNTLISANRITGDLQDFDKAYNEFIGVIDTIFASQQINYTIEEAVTVVGQPESKTAVIWLKTEKYLICSGFSAASTIRTRIYRDKALVGNKYFGVANRSRSIYKHLEDKGIILDESSIRGTIPDESTLTALIQNSRSARNSVYIFPEMTKEGVNKANFKLYQLVTKKDGKSLVGALIPYKDNTSYSYVAIQDITGSYEYFPIEKYVGFKVYTKGGVIDVTYYPDKENNAIVLDKRLLSVADVGHAYFIDRATGRTPAGSKLDVPQQIIDAFQNSPTQLQKVNAIIEKLKQQLNKEHGAVNFAFYKKQIQDQINASKTLNTRINNCIVVTFQDYKVNSDLASIESQILATLKRQIINELLNIPGSNTLKQDLAEAAINKAIEPLLKLNNKGSKKLKTTSNITIKEPFRVKTSTIKQSKGSFSKLSTVNSAVNLPIPNLTIKANRLPAQVNNLVTLQNLINASLVERVKANMGRGERRDVLNLRTGRFAESVKVERMSQSREGMITAFYSYMKNPYATFSQGGAQDAPKSRDPKLLIAKSIREIATQQVANRLRSVNI